MDTPAVEVQFSGGIAASTRSSGIVNAGVRKGPWTAELLTDTLQGSFNPSFEHGRAWVAVRGEYGAAGLFNYAWENGAPTPEHTLIAAYVGAEGGAIRYLPYGTWIGAGGGARYWTFGNNSYTTIPLPDARPVVSGDVHLGWYRTGIDVWIRAGGDFSPGTLAPHVAGIAHFRPKGWFSVRFDVWAGFAARQDEVTRTRVGGMTPYHPPISGTSFGEFRAERYAVGRLGPSLKRGITEASVFTDVAVVDGQRIAGFGVATRFAQAAPKRPWFLEASVGVSPWLERAAAHPPVSGWLVGGVDWTSTRRADVVGSGGRPE